MVVVDNSQGEPATENVARRFGARYVVEPRRGVSVARNTGALLATGDVVAYTDDDAVPDPDWLSRHLGAFRDQAVGATAGRVLELGSTGTPPAGDHEGDMGTAAFTIDRSTPRWFERANFGEIGIGPNMAFRRSLIERGWRFQEPLGVGSAIPGCEEHRAFSDAIANGYAAVYLPDAVVRHGGRLSPQDARRRRRRLLRASVAYGIMLAVEQPGARRLVLRHYAAALRHRGGVPAAGPRRNSPHETVDWIGIAVAIVSGPALYVLARLRYPSTR